MKYQSYRSKNHPVHEDIQPIVSAIKHGKKRIAGLRFQKLCAKYDLMRWEALAVANLIRSEL